MTKRVALYLRISGTNQLKGASLATQNDAAERYCAERGYKIVEVFTDVHTGSELYERPGMMALLAAVRARKVDVVLAHALDRLGRSQSHLGLLFSECDHKRVAIELTTEKLDDTPEGRLLQGVRAYAAEIERLKIRERTMRGTRERVAKGKALGMGKAPFGLQYVKPTYDADGHIVKGTASTHYEPDPVNVEHLRWMFGQADTGMSLRQIGFGLESRGVMPPYFARTGSAKWHASTVRDALTNRAYIGEGVAYKVKVEKVAGRAQPDRQLSEAKREYGIVATPRELATLDTIDPSPDPATAIPLPSGVFPIVIDPELFDRVQARLDARAADRAANSQRWDRDPEFGLLRRGLLRCPLCKTGLTVNPSTNGGPSYRHDEKARHQHGCPSVNMNTDKLDAQVWAWVEAITRDPERSERLFNRLRHDDGEMSTAATVANYDRRIAEIDAQLGNIADNMTRVTGRLFDDLAGKWQLLDDERVKLDADRSAWTAKLADVTARRERVERMQRTCDDVRARLGEMSIGEKRQALRDLGATVWLNPETAENRWTATFAFDLDGRGMRSVWANPVALFEMRPDGTDDDDRSYLDFSNVSATGNFMQHVPPMILLAIRSGDDLTSLAAD